MRTAFTLFTVVALAAGLTGCSPTEGEEVAQLHVLLEEPTPDEAAPLEDGAELAHDLNEAREALPVLLKGVPAPPADEPLRFELVRAFDAPTYMDIDPQDGPEQWITVAEVQDAEGNVLWTDRVNSLYQLLEYLELVLDQQSNLNFGIDQVFGFVLMQYPQLLEFAVKVPLGIEGGVDYVLKVPRTDGTLYEAYRAPIADLVGAAEPPQLSGEVTTVLDNGDSRDRIDIVILGDGYTADQRERFELDAQAIANRFAETEPFKTKLDDFNIHVVFTPSNEAGAGYDCTGILTADRGCKNDLRDTVFEMVFVLSAIADRFNLDLADTSTRVAMPLQIGRLFEAAASVPYDEIVMISNTRRSSGFAGLYVSVLTAYDSRVGFPDTAVHELGHSFGVLGDEYNLEGDPCLYNEPEIPLPANISATAARDELKWAHLVEEGTPLPTSLSDVEDRHDVGAFAGAYNCDEMYRPAFACKMRNSEQDPFCPVCAEQLVNRVFAYVDPLAAGQPATVTREGSELVFQVPQRDETITTRWFLGDDEVGEGAELRLGADTLPGQWATLTARVQDASGFIVGERPRTMTTLQWWVRK